MNDILVRDFKNIFEKEQIPYMEIVSNDKKNIDLEIKVYFPKIVINICKFLDKKFELINKENVNLVKDGSGYYQVLLSLKYNEKQINVKIYSMLKHTWGIANNL